jgi:ubiquinone/menaquinone biosynthesis C-methylase UbiE
MKILDFSPSRSLYRKLKRETYFSYTATDLSGEFLADKQYDITDLDLPDDSFDLIICYHILEHVKEDLKAMQELYRVLKSSGVCIIQSPFKEGDIFEDPSIRTPEERHKHYGQADHVRIYSVGGLAKRLSIAGFQIEVKAFTEKPGNKNGFKEQEYVLVAKKEAKE